MSAHRPNNAARQQSLKVLRSRAARNPGESSTPAPDAARHVTATTEPLHEFGGAAIYYWQSKEARINKVSNDIVVPAVVASNLERIAEAVAEAPDIDTDRVQAAKDALARGVYEINPERIAEKLMQIDTASRGNERARRG